MNEQYEDTVCKITTIPDRAIQKAWNMMSMHNSELLLENYELKEQLMASYNISIFRLICRKVRKLFVRDWYL